VILGTATFLIPAKAASPPIIANLPFFCDAMFPDTEKTPEKLLPATRIGGIMRA
jgi:hypothetical protein